MFHRFKVEQSDEVIAVGIVMPSGTCFVEWLENKHQDDATAYPGGIAEVIGDVDRLGLEFEWVDDPESAISDKVVTDGDSE